jgi:hypothetical protein
MAKTPRQREQNDRGEASAEKPMRRAEAAEAMERFKTLARALLAVPLDKLRAEQSRAKERRQKKRVKQGRA